MRAVILTTAMICLATGVAAQCNPPNINATLAEFPFPKLVTPRDGLQFT